MTKVARPSASCMAATCPAPAIYVWATTAAEHLPQNSGRNAFYLTEGDIASVDEL